MTHLTEQPSRHLPRHTEAHAPLDRGPWLQGLRDQAAREHDCETCREQREDRQPRDKEGPNNE